MKIKTITAVLLGLACALSACKDDTANAGSSALTDKDGIRVKADTFAVQSALGLCQPLSLTPDSFLLGECDTRFGTIKADILTQLACPEGFAYPSSETAEVDSVCLFLYYNSWYGDGKAPLGITVYEMDRATLNYGDRYPSDTALAAFCSLEDSTHISQSSRIVFAAEPTDSLYSSSLRKYVPFIRIKLTDDFAKRFFRIRSFASQEEFQQQFKGLYIATDFGGGTVLHISDISMAVYYRFTYPASTGNDTTLTDIKAFYANTEVKQVNRYIYPDREQIISQLDAVQDTNFIVSPANIYTRLTLRMDSILNTIEDRLGDSNDYRVYVNRANLTVDVLYSSETSARPRDNWDTPATYMLLIKEDYMETFFAKNHLPSDTAALLATLTATTDSLANVSYTYSYDLSTLLTNQLRSPEPAEQVTFVLVPVEVTTTATSSSSSAVSSVKQLQTISATCIRSADNPVDPMDIEMVYSAFNKGWQ